jgi:hypothetical protein
MLRKEVVVGTQVFDLGINGLADAVANRDGRLPTVELEIGHQVFVTGYMRDEKAVYFNWWGETNWPNVNWTRFIFLRRQWPFITAVTAFTYATEGS